MFNQITNVNGVIQSFYIQTYGNLCCQEISLEFLFKEAIFFRFRRKLAALLGNVCGGRNVMKKIYI